MEEIRKSNIAVKLYDKNNDSYKSQYPNCKYNNSNAAMIASSIIDSIESSREPITNSFTVAKAINGVKNYTDHANEVERKITEALASKEAGNVRDKLNEQYNKLDKRRFLNLKFHDLL
jgi:chaperonin GroEL (HSP60 family)